MGTKDMIDCCRIYERIGAPHAFREYRKLSFGVCRLVERSCSSTFVKILLRFSGFHGGSCGVCRCSEASLFSELGAGRGRGCEKAPRKQSYTLLSRKSKCRVLYIYVYTYIYIEFRVSPQYKRPKSQPYGNLNKEVPNHNRTFV